MDLINIINFKIIYNCFDITNYYFKDNFNLANTNYYFH